MYFWNWNVKCLLPFINVWDPTSKEIILHEISASQHWYKKPRKEITTNTSWLELGAYFLDSLLDHGMMGSIKICRFKTFLEQCFDKEPSCPEPLYVDISVKFAFDSCVEISKFLKSGNTTENNGNTLSKLHRDTSLFGKFCSGICRFKKFCMRIFARETFLWLRCSNTHVKCVFC